MGIVCVVTIIIHQTQCIPSSTMYRLSRAGLRALSLAASAPSRCQVATVIRPFSSLTAGPRQQARPSILSFARVRTYATENEAQEPSEEPLEESSSAAQPGATEPLEDLEENLQQPGSGRPISADDQSSGNDMNYATRHDTVYVGNIFFGTSEDALRDEFGRYGTIERVSMPLNERGQPRGIAYISYKDAEHATAAIEGLNQSIFEGRTINVAFARRRFRGPNLRDSEGRGISPPSRTLFIGNLDHQMTDSDLNELFRDLSNVLDVRVAIDRRTGAPRGFAHADFTDEASASAARERIVGREFYGRRVFIDYGRSASQR